MQVEFVFLANSAEVHGSGVCALGAGVDLFLAATFPADHAPLVLIAKLTYGQDEERGESWPVCEIVTSRGQSLTTLPIGADFEVSPAQHPGGRRALVCWSIPSMRFPQADVYTFELTQGDRTLAAVPFYVIQRSQGYQGDL